MPHNQVVEGYFHPFSKWRERRVICSGDGKSSIYGHVSGEGIIAVQTGEGGNKLEFHAGGYKRTSYLITFNPYLDLLSPELRIGMLETEPPDFSDKNCIVCRLALGDSIRIIQERGFIARKFGNRYELTMLAQVNLAPNLEDVAH